MAIIKSFQTNFGITATYHKLAKIEIIPGEEVLQLIIGVYASKIARDNGAKHLWTEYVRIPLNRLSFDPRDIFYPLLKEYENSYLINSIDSIDESVTIHPPVFSIVEPPSPPEVPPLPPIQ